MKQEITAQVVIVDETTPKSIIDGIAKHLDISRGETLNKIADFSIQLTELKKKQVDQELEDAAKAFSSIVERQLVFKKGANWQKEQSATDAIEFAKWTQQNDWWYIDKHDYWMEGKWFDTELERFPSYTSKQLYELWQQSKKN
jgi:hypothetical protein